MQNKPTYNRDFYKTHQSGSRRSAQQIVPLVLELIRPKSVVDVGSGTGTWLSVFNESGILEFLGVDGDWVDPNALEIPANRFFSHDLTKPLRIDRRFDLVVSLEVAEHLPIECAETFVDSLINLGDVILFSAAIPCQGGTNHVNEQWPDYWTNLFKRKEYLAIDYIRDKVWQNELVEWWYAQNILLFMRLQSLEKYPVLKREAESTATRKLSIVHPRSYLELHRLFKTVNEIGRLIPHRQRFILVDHDVIRGQLVNDRWAIPFLEREGKYWGVPSDDDTAIRELTRLRKLGAKFVVFTWDAFWWLDYYAEFHNKLKSQYRCVLKNERLVVFDLSTGVGSRDLAVTSFGASNRE
jgi:Methyltransferase domain